MGIPGRDFECQGETWEFQGEPNLELSILTHKGYE